MIVNRHCLSPISAKRPAVLPSPARVAKIVRAVLKKEKEKAAGEINIVFVDSKKIRQLNKEFLDTKGDTDVIAFPYERPSGDVYIAVPVAISNARRYDEPIARELTRLVVHGTLHLLGYKDEPKKEKERMWAVQEPLVEELDRR